MSYYRSYGTIRRRKKNYKPLFLALVVAAVLIGGFVAFNKHKPTAEEQVANNLKFDSSVTTSEQTLLTDSINSLTMPLNKSVEIRAATNTEILEGQKAISAYLPVTNFYSAIQKISKSELTNSKLYFLSSTNEQVRVKIVEFIQTDPTNIVLINNLTSELPDDAVAIIPSSELGYQQKLLMLDENYYLDSFNKGAFFRTANIVGDGAVQLNDLKVDGISSKDEIFKVNMSGVTALTRVMLRKLNSVNDPLHFSKDIGAFLADADITHVSNEVSFKPGCTYHNALFCSDPRFIETLKASGVDLVELTGNHNNDLGSEFNTQTINQYRELGWSTVGGGLNTADAAKPYIADQKGSKVGFLAYNYPDSPNGGAIAGSNKAGANSFNFDTIKSDIDSLKQQSKFVIVNVQYWECYSYPDGYIEYPVCDKPIGEQESVFKRLVDLGADMVIGSSAHQPQTYEFYNDKPIYYGLGNLYFDQTSWPGTERGIILTHYFNQGSLIQTKLTPTVYDANLQTRIMTNQETDYILGRLQAAR
ncbi:MAG: CapA family protein [bacterium]|nr:CapA family protein [bacterium]